MKLDNFGYEGKTVLFSVLEDAMNSIGLERDGHWDYERATYDFKFENMTTGAVYYLRVPAVAVEGVVEQQHAKMKIGTAYLGRHYYPHGVEYDEDFPDDIIKTCTAKLNQLSEKLETQTV